MPAPILLFNYALSQSHAAASRSRHSDRLLPLLLILSSSTSFEQWQHGNSVTNDTLPSEHLVSEEFKHHLVRLKTILSKPNPLHHFPTIEPCRTIDIQHIVACNSNQASWGLSQTQAHEWHVAPSGVVLGLFDTALQLRRALLRSLLSPTTVVATTTASNDHGLAIKDMQKHVAVVADLFAQWSSTQEARNAARHCRHALQECGAVLHRSARHKQWLRQCATFREMQVFACKEDGTQAKQRHVPNVHIVGPYSGANGGEGSTQRRMEATQWWWWWWQWQWQQWWQWQWQQQGQWFFYFFD